MQVSRLKIILYSSVWRMFVRHQFFFSTWSYHCSFRFALIPKTASCPLLVLRRKWTKQTCFIWFFLKKWHPNLFSCEVFHMYCCCCYWDFHTCLPICLPVSICQLLWVIERSKLFQCIMYRDIPLKSHVKKQFLVLSSIFWHPINCVYRSDNLLSPTLKNYVCSFCSCLGRPMTHKWTLNIVHDLVQKSHLLLHCGLNCCSPAPIPNRSVSWDEVEKMFGETVFWHFSCQKLKETEWNPTVCFAVT